MRTPFMLLLLCILIQISPVLGQEPLSPQESANKLLNQSVEEAKLMGIAAGFSVDGKILWQSSAGYSDQEQSLEAKPDMLLRTASIVKPMTSVAILQLYEQNQIDLDASIQTYLPDFPVKKEGAISVRHLLQMSSGIKAYANGKEAKNLQNYPSLQEAVGIFQDRDLAFAPGSNFLYTTYGYVVLGLIIEKVSGLSYEEYMKKNVWDKCGMNHTGVEKYGSSYPNQASLYHKDKKGRIKSVKPTNLSDRVPGGGCYTTVGDMLQFGEAIINHQLIKESSLALMIANSGLKKEGNGYGMGWYLYGENPKYGNVFGHTGAQIGASGQLMILPEVKTSIIVLSNTSGALRDVSMIAVQLFQIAEEAAKQSR